MLIWHVHRKSCLAIDYDWFYRSNIYRPYISPQEYIVPWLSLGHSFLPKAPWKEKYCQQQQSRWENINVSMSPGSHPGSIFRVTLIMRLRLPTVGLVVQQSAKNLPSAPYRVICDISIVNTKFLNEDDVHMIFLSLFLCSWSLSCNRKVFSLPLSAWRCCSVAVMESELQARDRIGVQDFVLLEDFQSEDAFLENLKKRYNSGLIYVSTRNT